MPVHGHSWRGVSAFLLSATVPEIIDGNTLTATVVDLNAWVEYEFRVLAKNGVGVGEPSPVSVRTRTEDAGPALLTLSIWIIESFHSENLKKKNLQLASDLILY